MNKLQQRLEQIHDVFSDYSMVRQHTYFTNLRIARSAARSIQGAIVECGTWRGGMIAGIAALVGPDRSYHLFDSYEGLPDASAGDGAQGIEWMADAPGDRPYANCEASQHDAEQAMSMSGATNYTITKGWFSNTLPGYKIPEGIALLRLDGDLYESTIDCLTHLYPQVNQGGTIVLDDYFAWDGCAMALYDYLAEHRIPARLQTKDGVCRFEKPHPL